MRDKNKGFSLIELLVVIAIVGILASIVLVSIKGMRKKSEIAKVLQWSNSSIYHILGVNSMGIWSFNGDLKDSSGSGNNCSLHGDSDYVSGIAGQALEFDGTGDYVSCLDTGDKLDPVHEVTIEAWVYRKGSGTGIIVSKGMGTNYDIRYDSGDEKIDFVLACNTISSDSILPLDTWTHVAAIKGSSNEMRMYINGEKQSDEKTCSALLQSATSLYIGGDGANDFEGLIDEVRIYSEGFSENIAREHYLTGKLTHR
ncbi:hypothetical protein AMJ49_03915 [Parcubacteria bacterium DG_74_2]|nr:MAG: hypothetical protein AMJ49_03915 [Parcubacteria bacterium DG_74_2]